MSSQSQLGAGDLALLLQQTSALRKIKMAVAEGSTTPLEVQTEAGHP